MIRIGKRQSAKAFRITVTLHLFLLPPIVTLRHMVEDAGNYIASQSRHDRTLLMHETRRKLNAASP